MKRVVTVPLILGGFVVSAAGGILAGYLAGFDDAIGQAAPSEAVTTTLVLRAIRSGDTEQAVQLLETQLDSYLIARWSYDQSRHLLFPLLFPVASTSNPIGTAAKYRAEFPTPSADPGIKAAIDEIVMHYGSIRPRSGTRPTD